MIHDFVSTRLRKLVLGAGLLGIVATGTVALTASSAYAAHVVKYTASCSTIFGNMNFKGSLTNNPPASVNSGASFSVPGNRITITIPANLVADAKAVGVKSFKGSLTEYTINSSDASPASFNAAGSGVKIPATNLPNSGALTLYIPGKTKSFTISGMTAGSKGTDTGTLGASSSTVYGYSGKGGTGTKLVTDTSNCTAPSPAAVAWTITVS